MMGIRQAGKPLQPVKKGAKEETEEGAKRMVRNRGEGVDKIDALLKSTTKEGYERSGM